jgi:hypothetical protein
VPLEKPAPADFDAVNFMRLGEGRCPRNGLKSYFPVKNYRV